MILLRLFYEFFKTGLFAVGGGMATIPFLQNIGATTGWFTDADLTTMIAVSESTPGPIGVNMATLGLITPSIIIIIIIAGMLKKFRQSKLVDDVFYGLRPASTALITSAGLSVALSIFILVGGTETHTFSVNWMSLILAALVFIGMRVPKLKKLHPIVFIGVSALIGILFRM